MPGGDFFELIRNLMDFNYAINQQLTTGNQIKKLASKSQLFLFLYYEFFIIIDSMISDTSSHASQHLSR